MFLHQACSDWNRFVMAHAYKTNLSYRGSLVQPFIISFICSMFLCCNVLHLIWLQRACALVSIYFFPWFSLLSVVKHREAVKRLDILVVCSRPTVHRSKKIGYKSLRELTIILYKFLAPNVSYGPRLRFAF